MAKLERKAHVLAHRHVRVEGVVLEDHRNVTVLRWKIGDVASADGDGAPRRKLQPGHHAQRRRFSTAGWSHQHQELAWGHLERKIIHRGQLTRGVDLLDVTEGDSRLLTCNRHADILPYQRPKRERTLPSFFSSGSVKSTHRPCGLPSSVTRYE